MSYGTVQAEKMTTESGYSLGAGNASSFKNRIINSGMVIDQRNAGASVSNIGDGQVTLDRWASQTSVGNKFSIQQNAGSVTPPAGFTNYIGATSTSAYSVIANDFSTIQQNIEGFNVSDLGWGTANAKDVTVSFWVRSSLTGSFGGTVANSAQDRTYPFAYTINSANTWEYKTVTIPGDTTGTWLTNSSLGIRLRFSLGCGSSRVATAGVWTTSLVLSATGTTSILATNGATLYITGVQLEVGTVATSFDFRSYGTEMMLCQRYYQQHGFYGVVGQGQNTDRNSGSYVSFFVPMRTTPTTIAKNYDVDIGDLNIAFTPSIYTDAIGQGIGWRPYRNIATTITRGDTMEIMANAGTEGGPRHPFNAEL
jgi:hypothetical protein